MLNIIIILGIFSALLFIFQEKVIFFPSSLPADFDFPAIEGRKIEKVLFPTPDGLKLSGVFIETQSGSGSSGLPWILYSHGNAGHLLHRYDQLKGLSQLPANFFIYDFRGFGASEGKTDIAGAIVDGESALKFLMERKNIPSERVILYGVSLGGGVTTSVLKKSGKKFAGLVMESTFRSLSSRAGSRFPIIGPLVLHTDYPSDQIIKEFTGKALFIHSTDDRVIPFSDGETLFSLCPSKEKTFFKLGSVGHNDPVWLLPNYLEAWKTFLASIK